MRQVGVLADGTPVSVRPLVASDRAWFAEWTAALSDRSKYRRFLGCYRQLPDSLLDQLVDGVDGTRHTALVATVPALPAGEVTAASWPDPRTMPVAVGRFIHLRTDGAIAEVAYTVTDAWQGRGVGTLLLQALVIAAAARGVTTFTATVLVENLPSLRLLRKAGRVIRWAPDGAEVGIEVELTVPPADVGEPSGAGSWQEHVDRCGDRKPVLSRRPPDARFDSDPELVPTCRRRWGGIQPADGRLSQTL